MITNRTLRLRARRVINPFRKATVVIGDKEASTVRLTCKTCGHVWDKVLKGIAGPLKPDAVEAYVRWWSKNNDVTVHCPACTKQARDRAMPLKGAT